MLSHFFFSLYVRNLPITSPFIECKYADDIVFSCKPPTLESSSKMQGEIDKIVRWSSSRSLTLNATKCQDVLFSLCSDERHRGILDSCALLTANSQAIPMSSTVKYLGIMLSRNLSWSIHVLETFSKVRKLSFYSLRLKMLSVPHRLIFKFVTACILPHGLYCYPLIFHGLLQKDYSLLVRSLKHISKCSGISRVFLVDFLISKHFTACSQFSNKILTDTFHPLHTDLSKAVSTSSTRANFKLLFSRTTSYRNSVLPYLSRLLVNPEQAPTELRRRLLK
ncbi:hypothetical protein H7673_10995 [Streptococcus dysgalactiae subsp. equisimilis]|nr:hypothetical protein [Streptococcus dysgalactiae subsp. equisimilis]